jgi:membrane-bound metal-dependent hydrolase YbcI (DUF457 family)
MLPGLSALKATVIVPVTPFHFGPGVLLKACAPRSVSLTAFVATQVVIDIESGYHLYRGDWPIHREAHSLLISGLLGLATGLLVWLVARHRMRVSDPLVRSEIARSAALCGGLVGGLTHPILDAVMHPDLRPFWPVSMANPFLDTIGFGALHLGCVASGLVGAGVLMFRCRSGLRPG